MTHEGETLSNIRQLIKSRRVPVKYLANKLNIPYRRLQNYIYGQSEMPVSILFAIADTLGVSVDYLRFEKPSIEHHILQQALFKIFGQQLPICDTDGMHWELRPRPQAVEADFRSAGLLAFMIRAEYEMALAQAVSRPLELDEVAGTAEPGAVSQ
jgi:transcriptional regulator with XRE-family HTH domain